MIFRTLISILFSLLFCMGAAAFDRDTSGVVRDTLSRDSVRVDKGFDAGKYVNAKRWRAPAHSEFQQGPWKNISVGLHTDMIKMTGDTYSYGQSLGLDVIKWVIPSFGVRVSGGYGSWIDNLDAQRTNMVDVSASALFNMMAYVGGYDTSRLCEISLVGGVAYSCLWKEASETDNVFSTLFGLNLDMRIYDRLHLVLEPQVNIYYNSKLHIDTWRSYMTGFTGRIGLNYSFSQVRPPQPRQTKYFISLLMGAQMQNSSRVWNAVLNGSARSMAGVQFGVGYGRWFTDWFATRLTATYSRNAWMKGRGYLRYTRYMNVRFEGMFNLLGMWENKWSKRIALSAVVGPEFGRMIKEDKKEPVSVHYIGLSAGANATLKVCRFFSLFAEPRISVVPYSAVSADLTSGADNRNYYDALLGLNVGINVLIP